MNSTPATTPAEDALTRLLEHLRAHPRDQRVRQLANEYGLDEAIVEVAVRSRPGSGHREANRWARALERFLAPVSGPMTRFTKDKPLVYLVITVVLSLALAVVDQQLNYPSLPLTLFGTSFNVSIGVLSPALVPLFVACYAVAEWSFFGLSVLCRLLVVVASLNVYFASIGILPSILVTLIAAPFLAFDLVIATALGFNAEERRHQRALTTGDRRTMLGRLMEVRRALASQPAASGAPRGRLERFIAKRLTLRELGTVVGGLLAGSFGFVLIMRTATDILVAHGSHRAAHWVGSALSFLYVFAAIPVGIAVGMRYRSLFSALFVVLVAGVAMGLGDNFVLGKSAPVELMLSYSFRAVLGALIGAFVSAAFQSSRRVRRWAEQDPELLAAEKRLLEWFLSTTPQTVYVMSVDAVGSTRMKQNEDMFDIEYSFREYHHLVSEVSKLHGGRVHATAGDGAIVAFDSHVSAYRAAKQIQDEIPSFNAFVNKLAEPFRLRIGLHCGVVQDDLDSIRFSVVIDTCSHVDRLAPAGGIAASSEFAALLSSVNFEPVGQTQEGVDVLLAGTGLPASALTS